MLVAMLLSLALTHIRSPVLRRLYNTSFGLAVTFFNYGVSGFGLIPYNMICYFCLYLTPRRQSALVVGVLTGTILTIVHIHRYLHTDGQDYSIDTLMMMTFVKQTILAFNYKDGAPGANVTPREKKYSIEKIPSLLSYLAYVFSLQSSVIGPSFEYKDWDSFMDLKGDYAKMPPFSNYASAFIRFVHGLMCVGASIALSHFFSPKWMLTQEFADKFIGYKLAYMIPSMVSVQFNFFAGFKFEEAGLIACGFGYAETVKEDKVERIYDSVRAVRVRGVLASTKSADTFTNWNI